MFAPATRPPALSTLIAMTVVAILSLNMVLPSLAHMAEDLGVSYAKASLSISLFMLVTAVLQLVIGPISDIHGRRPMLLAAMAVFTVASLGCALAGDFLTFMVFRCIQAIVVAAMVMSRTIVRDTAAPQDAAAILGTIGMVMALGPMLSPVVGGFLDQVFGWRASFHALTLLGAATLWLCWADVGETNVARGQPIGHHFRAYPQLLTNPVFWSYTACLGLSSGVYFGFLTGTPLIATEHFGLTGTLLGLGLGLPPVGFMLGNWLSSRLSRRVRLPVMLMTGRLVTILGMVPPLVLHSAGFGSALTYFLFMPLIGLGNGLSMPAGNVGAMSVKPDLAGSAAGLSGAVMIGMGAAMTAITGMVLTRWAEPTALLWLLNMAGALGIAAALPAFLLDRTGRPATG